MVKDEVVPEDTLEALEEIREAQEEQATEEAEEVIESKAKEIIAERGEEQKHKEVIEQKRATTAPNYYCRAAFLIHGLSENHYQVSGRTG